MVRIRSWAKFVMKIFTVLLKSQKRTKEAGNGPLKKLRGDIIASNHSHPLFGQFS